MTRRYISIHNYRNFLEPLENERTRRNETLNFLKLFRALTLVFSINERARKWDCKLSGCLAVLSDAVNFVVKTDRTGRSETVKIFPSPQRRHVLLTTWCRTLMFICGARKLCSVVPRTVWMQRSRSTSNRVKNACDRRGRPERHSLKVLVFPTCQHLAQHPELSCSWFMTTPPPTHTHIHTCPRLSQANRLEI